MRQHRFAAAAVVIAIVAVARVASTWAVFSQTPDEPLHARAGYEWLTTNHYEADPEHPPLARAFFALRAVLAGIPANELPRPAHYIHDLGWMRAGNLPFLLLGIAIVYAWTRRLFGAPEALIAVALFASLPVTLAHAALATTDMACTATVAAALYALWCWCDAPSLGRASILGVAIGVGLLAKHSFILFFTAGAIGFLIARRPRRMLQLSLSALIAAVMVWAGYKFTFGKMSDAYPSHSVQFQAAQYAEAKGYEWIRADHIEHYRRFAFEASEKTGVAGIDFVDWARAAGFASPLAGRAGVDTMLHAPPVPPPGFRDRVLEPVRRAQHWIAFHVPLPAPMYFVGIEDVSLHAEGGQPGYILGERYRDGRWFYFPVLLFFKTPLAFLVLAIPGLALVARRAPALALAPLLMLAVLLPSRINLGIRHALAIVPFLAICAACAAIWLWRRGAPARALLVVLLLWFFIPPAMAHPDYLPWFNEVAGKHPEHIAVDSNLDWGQDLLRLKTEIQRANARPLHLAYFGTADWRALGIDATPLPRDNRCVEGWVAISETERVMTHDDYAWLDAYRPKKRVGRSIRLYEIPKCGTNVDPRGQH